MYKKIFLLIMFCCSSFLQASNQAPNQAPLIVGTNAEFAPFTFIEKGEIVGFDIDIAKEVAKRLGKQIQFKDMPFDALIPDVVLANVDFVAAGMSYTEERAKRVLFTRPYLSGDPLVIFTTNEKKLSLENLHGKNVAVIEGFTADLFMSTQPGVNLTRLPTQADGFMAITSERVDAFVTSKSTVDAFYKTQKAAKFCTTMIPGTGETCALVVSKKKPEVLVEVQKALDTMEQDGTMNALKSKWGLQ